MIDTKQTIMIDTKQTIMNIIESQYFDAMTTHDNDFDEPAISAEFLVEKIGDTMQWEDRGDFALLAVEMAILGLVTEGKIEGFLLGEDPTVFYMPSILRDIAETL